MIEIRLKVCPPFTTAQMKRVKVINGKPRFFHGAAMKREEATWIALLSQYAPAAPMDGPLSLSIRMTYPHLKSVSKRDADRVIPKTTRPDLDGAVKHLTDQLTRLRFIEDDARVAQLTVSKFHGPAHAVGIDIQISSFNPS